MATKKDENTQQDEQTQNPQEQETTQENTPTGEVGEPSNNEEFQEEKEEIKQDPPIYEDEEDVEEEDIPVSGQLVTVESSDGRTLYVNHLGHAYEGKSIEVPVEYENEIRRILTDGGFSLK